MQQEAASPLQIPINQHIYPEANSITTTKSLYDFVSDCEGVQNIQFYYNGNVIPKNDKLRIPELGYEFGDNLEFLERTVDIYSINLIIHYGSKEKKVYFENQRISNFATEYDHMILISRLLHTSPTNIIFFSETKSEINNNEINFVITLKKGYSVYDVEYINAARQGWKHTRDRYVLEEDSTIRDLRLCITSEFTYKTDQIAFYSDNESAFDERTKLEDTHDEVLCFIYTPDQNQVKESAPKHNIYLNNQHFLTISYYDDYCFYQIAYLIEKKGILNKNFLSFCGKTINSPIKYQTIPEITPDEQAKQNLMITTVNVENSVQVRVKNTTNFYDLYMTVNSTVFDLRKKIIEHENCDRYFGLVYLGRYMENSICLFSYYIDEMHPIEVVKITPRIDKVCDIFSFREQIPTNYKKQQEPIFNKRKLLLPINAQCQDVKQYCFHCHPKSMSFISNSKVFADSDKMHLFDVTKYITVTRKSFECYYILNGKHLTSMMMKPDSTVRSLLKKISTKKLFNVQFEGKTLQFFHQLNTTSPNEYLEVTKVDKVKVYDMERKFEYPNDNLFKKCFKNRVSKTIKLIQKQLNNKSEIKLFSDFIELDMKENPFLCCPTIYSNTFFINSNDAQKTINLVNPFNVSIQLKSDLVKYQKPIDFIIGFFGVPEKKITLTYDKYNVPLEFSIWSLPNDAVIHVNYPKNIDEYSQKFIYEDQLSIIPYKKETTLFEMKKILHKKFDIVDCSLNCISLKFGEKEIINSREDNECNFKTLLSNCYIYPLAFVVIATPTKKNRQNYNQVKITMNKNTSNYYFAKDDIIQDVRILLEDQEGVPIEGIYDASDQRLLGDTNYIPQSLIVKFRHYEVSYLTQSFSFEYSLSVRKAEGYIVEKLNLPKSDTYDYRIAYKRSFDNKIMPAKDQDLKRYNKFFLIRYFKLISIVLDKKLLKIMTNLNETLNIRAFKRYVRNKINKPSNRIILSLDATNAVPIDDDQQLGDVIRPDSPIYISISETPIVSKKRKQQKQPNAKKPSSFAFNGLALDSGDFSQNEIHQQLKQINNQSQNHESLTFSSAEINEQLRQLSNEQKQLASQFNSQLNYPSQFANSANAQQTHLFNTQTSPPRGNKPNSQKSSPKSNKPSTPNQANAQQGSQLNSQVSAPQGSQFNSQFGNQTFQGSQYDNQYDNQYYDQAFSQGNQYDNQAFAQPDYMQPAYQFDNPAFTPQGSQNDNQFGSQAFTQDNQYDNQYDNQAFTQPDYMQQTYQFDNQTFQSQGNQFDNQTLQPFDNQFDNQTFSQSGYNTSQFMNTGELQQTYQFNSQAFKQPDNQYDNQTFSQPSFNSSQFMNTSELQNNFKLDQSSLPNPQPQTIIINESDLGLSSSDTLVVKKYSFKLEDGEVVKLEFPAGSTISDAKEKIADYLNEKNKDEVEIEDVDSSSIEINYMEQKLKRKTVLESINFEEGEIMNVFVRDPYESIILTSQALRFTKEDLEKAAAEEDVDEEEEEDD